MTPTMMKCLGLAGLLCGLGLGTARLGAADTLLPYNSPWYYFDDGYLPALDWAQTTYDDGDWKYGVGQFGYGDGDEATVVSYGPDDEHKFVTTYFRTYLTINNPAQYSSITLNLIRDDGAVVYVNGVEAFRSNLPEGVINFETYALTGLVYSNETTPASVALNSASFVDGYNLIAVEVHQFEPASPDLSFDLQILGNSAAGATVVRGPYLQSGTSSNLIVRWRTSQPTSTRVRYGASAGNLGLTASHAALVTDHEITLPGLSPDTKYFYDIGTTTAVLAGDATYYFVTAPLPGTTKPTRIWAIGDAGTGYYAQGLVRDAYTAFTGAQPTDVWLMLGDNAYGQGLDNQYQAYMFNAYSTLLRQNVVWSTMGNHETGGGNQALSDAYAYYDIFTLPNNGQAGGVPSGTEHYYSFDYANIHFVCLDTQTAIYRQPGSAMLQWLVADLANNTRDWTIAFFHHPPYTLGSHTSEAEGDLIQVRQNILPVLESSGVDMVLTGHSHVYERSYLIDGFYGYAASATPANFINHGNGRTNGTGAYVRPASGAGAHRGTVYVTDGSSGGQGTGGSLNHPAHFYSVTTPGSLVLDITGLRLDGKFISGYGTVDDTFTILKEAPPAMQIAKSGADAVVSWPVSLLDYQLEAKSTVNTPAWSPSGGTVATNGPRKTVTLPATGAQKFFHLRNLP